MTSQTPAQTQTPAYPPVHSCTEPPNYHQRRRRCKRCQIGGLAWHFCQATQVGKRSGWAFYKAKIAPNGQWMADTLRPHLCPKADVFIPSSKIRHPGAVPPTQTAPEFKPLDNDFIAASTVSDQEPVRATPEPLMAQLKASLEALKPSGGTLSGSALQGTPLTPETKPVPPSKPAKPALPEPEDLLTAAVLAAWSRAYRAIKCPVLALRVLLWGPPGTGKTELPWRIAQELGWEHVQQQMTEETPATELLGHPIVSGGSTVWLDGSLGRAIRISHTKPVIYVIDEVGRASADALSACILALTNPESLRLTLRSGEVISPNVANWHCVATSNEEPRMLPVPIQDRLHVAVQLDGPNPALIRSMGTVEARRLACAMAREHSIRALLTYDRLVVGGMDSPDSARLVWEPSVAQSFLDATRVERGA